MEKKHMHGFCACGRNLAVKPDMPFAKKFFSKLHNNFLEGFAAGDTTTCLLIQCILIESFAISAYNVYIRVADPFAKRITEGVVQDEYLHLNYGQEWLKANLDSVKKDLMKANKDLDKLIKSVKSELNKDFKSIVFHDAYQYFEKRFNVNILGAFTVNTDVMPGAEQLAEIREVIEHDKVSCIFSEPQFNPDIIKAVAKDMKIQTGVLDPLGATLNPGKDLYFDLIGNMSKSFKGC